MIFKKIFTVFAILVEYLTAFRVKMLSVGWVIDVRGSCVGFVSEFCAVIVLPMGKMR